MGEIHELFVLALSLVWLAGATPENQLSDPTEIAPLSRDRGSNTPVALCFLWYRRLLLPHPHFFP